MRFLIFAILIKEIKDIFKKYKYRNTSLIYQKSKPKLFQKANKIINN